MKSRSVSSKSKSGKGKKGREKRARATPQERDRVVTKRSLRTVSEVQIESREEEEVLRLIASLEGVSLRRESEIAAEIALRRREAALREEEEEAAESCEESSSSEEEEEGSDNSESDSDSDSDSSSSSVEYRPAPNVMTYAQFARKLTRTDRFERKQWRCGGERERSAETLAAKLRSSIAARPALTQAPTPTHTQTHTAKTGMRKKVHIMDQMFSSPSLSLSASLPPQGATVRLSVECEGNGKSKSGKAALLVVDRSLSLEALLALCRRKHNVGAKYNTLLLLSTDTNTHTPTQSQKLSQKASQKHTQPTESESAVSVSVGERCVDELELMTMKDGQRLLLAAREIARESVSRKSSHSTHTPTQQREESEPAVEEAEESKSVENNNSNKDNNEEDDEDEDEEREKETAAEDEFWTPSSLHRERQRERESGREHAPLIHNDTLSLALRDRLLRAQCVRAMREQGKLRERVSVSVGEEENDETSLTLCEEVCRQRVSLPVYQRASEFFSLIDRHRVLIVCGETGSGKSTQVPQLLLQREILCGRGTACRVVVTQPRRIAAVSLAQRVHDELYAAWPLYEGVVRDDSGVCDTVVSMTASKNSEGEDVSVSTLCDEVQRASLSTQQQLTEEKSLSLGAGLVGYSVRLDSRQSDETRLLFCTTGVLLRKLQSDAYLQSVSHIVIDEVHERGVETDFLMAILKQKMQLFPHLKLILMSATMQEETFQRYFDNAPVLHISGRAFPVDVRYLETIKTTISNKRMISDKDRKRDNTSKSSKASVELPSLDVDLVADLVTHIISTDRNNTPVVPGLAPTAAQEKRTRGEAILVFLSGIQAIDKAEKAMRNRDLLRRANIKIHLLHGTLPVEHQRRVFRPTAPGEWKIVLATNIAETSITVDDVTHVIDTGFMKEQRYWPATGIHTLQEVFVSRSSAKQRAGRAGRVKPGTCWRLYNEAFFNASPAVLSTVPSALQVADFDLPEIQRIALEEVILQVLYLGLGRPEVFLLQCLSPPAIEQIKAALATLIEIKAVYPRPGFPLTALGWHLAQLPVDVRIGKMLVYASLLDCLDPVLTIAAALSAKSPLQSPPDQREKARVMQRRFLHYREFVPSSNKEENSVQKGPKYDDDEDDDDPYPEGDDVLHCRSDHIAIVHAFTLWQSKLRREGPQAAYAFCREYFLSPHTMKEIDGLREYYREHLASHGFAADLSRTASAKSRSNKVQATPVRTTNAKFSNVIVEDTEETSFDRNLVRCAICAGFFPNVVRAFRVQDVKNKNARECIKMVQSDSRQVFFHPSSLLNGQIHDLVSEDKQDAFLIYHRKTDTGGQMNVFDATAVPHVALLLFAGHEIQLSNPGKKKNARVAQRVVVQRWIEMALSELHLACFRRVAKEIEKVLRNRVENPSLDMNAELGTIRAVLHILLNVCEDDEE